MTDVRLPFLSDEWRAAVRELVAEHAGTAIDQPGLLVNITITDVPFGSGTLEMHSEHGPMVGLVEGHRPGADIELRTDYYTAKSMVMDASPDASLLQQGFESGAIAVTGDLARYRQWWVDRIADRSAAALDDQVRAFTA
jgi:hypothetical protein